MDTDDERTFDTNETKQNTRELKYLSCDCDFVFLPEGDGIRVVLAAFSHQESTVPGNTHQHVFCLNTGQTGVVPPENTL